MGKQLTSRQERIAEAIRRSGRSQADIARDLGIQPQSITGWLTTGRIGKKSLLYLARVSSLTPDEILEGPMVEAVLLAGEGRPVRPPVGNTDPVSRSSEIEIAAGYVRLPQYAVEVSAGDGANVDESDLEVVRYLDVAKWWAQQHLPRDLNRVRVLGVRGDSMAPDMQHGDVLFVDTATRSFDAAGLYILNWQGRALVKRLVPEMRSGRLALVSTNPAYPPEYVEPGEIDQLHIGGRVSAWWTLRKY